MFAFSKEAFEWESKIDMDQAFWQRTIAERIKEQINQFYLDNAEDGYRSHLGWSVIGHPCLRYLYYHWNWMQREEHSGRMEAIFIEGHKIETEIRKILKAKGAIFHDEVDENGSQIKVSDLGGHFGGSCDGIFSWPAIGLTEPTLLECKSIKSQGFKPLITKGVMAEKPQHYSQQSGYGYKLGIKFATYITRNKNDSTYFIEIVDLDWTHAQEMTRKAEFVILTNEVPNRISEKRSYYVCNMCSYQDICHDRKAPTPNCRNCTSCTPVAESKFHCKTWQSIIPNKQALIKGCNEHHTKPY